MSAKDYILRILSVDMAIPEKTLNAVITHQFQSAYEAMDLNKSLEVSGFGKFMFNDKKAVKKMASLQSRLERYTLELENNSLTEANRAKITEIIRVINKQIVQLKPKLNHD
jgi:nucleoid DNA-binding protein